MRFWTLSTSICLGLLLACSRSGVTSTRYADGTREIRCEHPLWKCLRHIDDYCRGASFEVLHASDEQLRYGSDASEIEGRKSRALVLCMKPGVAPRAWEVNSAAPPASAAPPPRPAAAPAPAPAPKRACVPGSSQACVGPAACAGGQACLPDGSGFGPCDCGPPAAAAAPVAPAPPAKPAK